MTALCNQPEAIALDFGDDQSRYLYLMLILCSLQMFVLLLFLGHRHKAAGMEIKLN